MTQPPESQEEVERLRAERDALRDQLEAKDEKRRRRGRVRRTFVVLLVVLASLLVPLATTAVWARRTVVNTDQFEETVGPLAREPAVQVALTNRLTTQIMGAINVEQLFAEALPERGQFLAAPLTNAIEGFVREKVDTVVSSEEFARLWEEATRRAQIGMLAVLRDESQTVRTENGQVVLNLVPVINDVLASINADVTGGARTRRDPAHHHLRRAARGGTGTAGTCARSPPAGGLRAHRGVPGRQAQLPPRTPSAWRSGRSCCS